VNNKSCCHRTQRAAPPPPPRLPAPLPQIKRYQTDKIEKECFISECYGAPSYIFLAFPVVRWEQTKQQCHFATPDKLPFQVSIRFVRHSCLLPCIQITLTEFCICKSSQTEINEHCCLWNIFNAMPPILPAHLLTNFISLCTIRSIRR